MQREAQEMHFKIVVFFKGLSFGLSQANEASPSTPD